VAENKVVVLPNWGEMMSRLVEINPSPTLVMRLYPEFLIHEGKEKTAQEIVMIIGPKIMMMAEGKGAEEYGRLFDLANKFVGAFTTDEDMTAQVKHLLALFLKK